MNVKITGQNIDVSEGLKSHIDEKIKKLTRHFDNIINVHIILKVEKKNQIAEATLHSSGNDFFAQASTDDMYKSIDSLISKIDSQIIKNKEKLISSRHHQ